jgi:glycerol uptake facilitator-like aquaporin
MISFLFFAFAGTQVANAHSQTPAESTTTNATVGFSPIVMLYIAISFGFSLMVNVWVFFRISGGLFNPAVSFFSQLLFCQQVVSDPN